MADAAKCDHPRVRPLSVVDAEPERDPQPAASADVRGLAAEGVE